MRGFGLVARGKRLHLFAGSCLGLSGAGLLLDWGCQSTHTPPHHTTHHTALRRVASCRLCVSMALVLRRRAVMMAVKANKHTQSRLAWRVNGSLFGARQAVLSGLVVSMTMELTRHAIMGEGACSPAYLIFVMLVQVVVFLFGLVLVGVLLFCFSL